MDKVFAGLITALGPNFLFIIAILLLIVIVVLIVLAVKTSNHVNINLGPLKFALKKKSTDINIPSLINSILDYQETHIRQILDSEMSLVKRQLNYAEQKLLEFKYVLNESYTKLLQAKLTHGEDVKLHRDYRFFQRIVNGCLRELKDSIFVDAIHDNHFDTMDGQTWLKYMDDKSVYSINFFIDYMDGIYEDNRLVTRKELSDEEKVSYSKLKDIIHDIFESCKQFAANTKTEIEMSRKEAREEIKKICSDVYGIDSERSDNEKD